VLDQYFLEENGHHVFADLEISRKINGFFTLMPLTNDWGTVYVEKDWTILTLNKLQPKYDGIKNKLSLGFS